MCAKVVEDEVNFFDNSTDDVVNLLTIYCYY